MYTSQYQQEPKWGLSYSDDVESWRKHPTRKLEISNLGKVRHAVNKKIYSTWQSHCGYECLKFGTNPRRTKSVHTLVAETWLPKRPYSYFTEVDHINRNRLDNRASNLRWVTHRLNHMNKNSKGYSRTKHGTYRVERVVLEKRLNLGTFKTEAEAKARSEEMRPRLWNLAAMFENVIDGVRGSIRNDRKLQVNGQGICCWIIFYYQTVSNLNQNRKWASAKMTLF